MFQNPASQKLLIETDEIYANAKNVDSSDSCISTTYETSNNAVRNSNINSYFLDQKSEAI